MPTLFRPQNPLQVAQDARRMHFPMGTSGESGGTPADTVEPLDGIGVAGEATEYSRGDHKHADEYRHTHENKDILDALEPSETVAALGGQEAVGTSDAYSRGDHKHALILSSTPVLPEGETITWSGIAATMVIDSAAVVSPGKLLAVESDGELGLPVATELYEAKSIFLATTSTTGSQIVITPGAFVVCSSWAWTHIGGNLWLSVTAGEISESKPGVGKSTIHIGTVLASDRIWFSPAAVEVVE